MPVSKSKINFPSILLPIFVLLCFIKIIWRYKWNSPYEAYPDNERTQKVAKDIFNVDNYIPDSNLKELIKRFNEF